MIMHKKTNANRNRSRTFIVAKFEFLRQIKKPAFWAATLLIPIFLVGMFLIGFFSERGDLSGDVTPDMDTSIAITDEAGILPADAQFVIDGNREQGIEMVKNHEIDLYFYIPADFASTNRIESYHIVEGLDIFNTDKNIIKGILTQYAIQKIDPVDVTILTGSFEVADNQLTANGELSNALGEAIIPLIFLVTFFVLICLFGNRFLLSVVEEKENRISEMVLTSVSAKHLIVGKIIAMLSLGLVQILTLVLPIVIILFIYRDNEIVTSIFSMIELNPASIALSLVFFIFSVLIFAGLCMFIGAITPTARDASQYVAPVIIGIFCPLYFVQSFLAAEPSFLTEFFTFFPLSAPFSLMLRSALGTLSLPEVIIGLVELGTLAVSSIWLTVRTFERNAINFEIVKPKFLWKKIF